MGGKLRRCAKCQAHVRVLQQGLCGSCYVAGRRDGSVQLVELSSTREAIADRLERFRAARQDDHMTIAAAGAHAGVSKRTAARYERLIHGSSRQAPDSDQRGFDQPAASSQ